MHYDIVLKIYFWALVTVQLMALAVILVFLYFSHSLVYLIYACLVILMFLMLIAEKKQRGNKNCNDLKGKNINDEEKD